MKFTPLPTKKTQNLHTIPNLTFPDQVNDWNTIVYEMFSQTKAPSRLNTSSRDLVLPLLPAVQILKNEINKATWKWRWSYHAKGIALHVLCLRHWNLKTEKLTFGLGLMQYCASTMQCCVCKDKKKADTITRDDGWLPDWKCKTLFRNRITVLAYLHQ